MSASRPAWHRAAVEWHGRKVLRGEMTRDEAARELAAEITRHPEFERELMAEIAGHLLDGKSLDEALDLAAGTA